MLYFERLTYRTSLFGGVDMRKRRLMIKFIIGLVAVVLLALGAYLFTHSPERVEQKVSQKREHTLPKSHEVAKKRKMKLWIEKEKKSL